VGEKIGLENLAKVACNLEGTFLGAKKSLVVHLLGRLDTEQNIALELLNIHLKNRNNKLNHVWLQTVHKAGPMLRKKRRR
jgi:hypothetical protein